MFKCTVLIGRFEREEEFKKYYLATHMPLAQKLPGMIRQEVTLFDAQYGQDSPRYCLMAELYFETEAAWRDAMETPIGQAVAADAGNFPEGTVFAGMFMGVTADGPNAV